MCKIYISGQITGLEPEVFTRNFDCAERVFLYSNMQVVNPLRIKPLFGIKRWLFFMVSDVYALSKCTDIGMQPNWIFSKGAVIEYFFAKFIFKLRVHFL